MHSTSLTRVLGAALALIAAACTDQDGPSLGAGGADSAESLDLPWEATALPDPPEPLDNPTTPAKVALGAALFYDPILGRDRATACMTCHSDAWGMSDGLPVSVGVDGEGPVGPGREGPNRTARNAPTLFNVAYRSSLFWDGRSPTLEDQALRPIENARELDLPVDEAIVRLRAVPEYVELFDAAFPDEIEPLTSTTLARALAAFQRTIVSRRAPYDRYVAGDDGALDADARDGMFLFHDAGCDGCHVPPLFASDRFAHRIESSDAGRFSETGDRADAGAFATPTLRNARETGPWFHDGSAASLTEAVTRESEKAAANGEGRVLTSGEIDRVVRFLDKGLTDGSSAPDRPQRVPSGLAVPADGNHVNR